MENISLLSNSRDNGFVGVNLYVDDEGSIRGLPSNPRASEVARACGKGVDVRGDAFLARVMDDGDAFARLDLTLAEVKSDAAWVRAARAQNESKQQQQQQVGGGAGRGGAGRRRAGGGGRQAQQQQLQLQQGGLHSLLSQRSPAALLRAVCPPGRPRAQGGGNSELERRMRAMAAAPAAPAAPAVRELTPAESAKDEGNAAFRRGDWAAAVEHYSRALELDPGLGTALNNRALCHIKLRQHAEAEADCSAVLARDAGNVKAFMRRATAR